LVSEEVGKIIENLDIVTKLKDFGSIFKDYIFLYFFFVFYKKKKNSLSCHEVQIFHLLFSAYAFFTRKSRKIKETKVIYGLKA
jgi:hypothetical protein